MDLTAACHRLAAHWGVPVRVTERYVEHHERVVFDTLTPSATRVVIKAYADPARAEAEAAALRVAAAAGVAVPEVVDRLPGMLVLSWLDGRPLRSESPDSHWAAVGRTLRRLHDHAVPDGVASFNGADDWWSGLDACLPQACHRSRPLLPTAVADRLSRIIRDGIPAGDPTPERMLHGDSATIHWRIREGAAAALDFGDACVGDPVWDLVVLTHWDEHQLPVVLDGYRAGPALRARVSRLYLPYQVIRHLLAVDWLVDHGYDPTPTLRELIRLATGPDQHG